MFLLQISSNGYFSIGSEVKKFQKVSFPLADASEDPLLVSVFRSRIQYRPDEMTWVLRHYNQIPYVGNDQIRWVLTHYNQITYVNIDQIPHTTIDQISHRRINQILYVSMWDNRDHINISHILNHPPSSVFSQSKSTIILGV